MAAKKMTAREAKKALEDLEHQNFWKSAFLMSLVGSASVAKVNDRINRKYESAQLVLAAEYVADEALMIYKARNKRRG